MLFMLRILVFTFLVEFSWSLGPSLEDLTHKQCPTPRPVLCLPYGLCCKYSEFCYAGLCESCFFDDVKGNLLDWCKNYGQHNVSLMRSLSCRLACQDEFTSQQLAIVNETIIYKEIDESIGKVQDSPENEDNYFGILVAVLGLLIVLILIVIMTQIRKPLLKLLRPKFLKLGKSEKIRIDLDSPQSSSGQPSRTDPQNFSSNNLQPAESSLEQEHDDPKKDDGEDGKATQPKSSKKPTKSKPVLTSSHHSAAASGSSENKPEVHNNRKKEIRHLHNPKNVVDCTDISETLPDSKINSHAGLKSCKPKKDGHMTNNYHYDDDIEFEVLNSPRVPLLATADEEKGLTASLPPDPSWEIKQGNVSVVDNSDSLSSDYTSLSWKEPKAVVTTLEEDDFRIHSHETINNSKLQVDSQRSIEELSVSDYVDDINELSSLGSSCTGIYDYKTVKLDDKSGAKASVTVGDSILKNGLPPKKLQQALRDFKRENVLSNCK